SRSSPPLEPKSGALIPHPFLRSRLPAVQPLDGDVGRRGTAPQLLEERLKASGGVRVAPTRAWKDADEADRRGLERRPRPVPARVVAARDAQQKSPAIFGGERHEQVAAWRQPIDPKRSRMRRSGEDYDAIHLARIMRAPIAVDHLDGRPWQQIAAGPRRQLL